VLLRRLDIAAEADALASFTWEVKIIRNHDFSTVRLVPTLPFGQI
jgi:hypothetical protein